VYQQGRFYYHAWNILYLGEWITADATLGKMPADVTHIRLVRGGADRQVDLMGVIGKLKLEIVELTK
jgi:transglutaminase-like putative cysteine protease